jgi:hypothetical protein
VTKLVLLGVAKEVELEYGGQSPRLITTTVFDAGGRALNSLCFRAAFCTIIRAVITFSKMKL